MTVLPKINNINEVNYFKELLFYNEKPEIKFLRNINLLAEQPFYKRLNIIKRIKHLKDMQCHIKLKQLEKKT